MGFRLTLFVMTSLLLFITFPAVYSQNQPDEQEYAQAMEKAEECKEKIDNDDSMTPAEKTVARDKCDDHLTKEIVGTSGVDTKNEEIREDRTKEILQCEEWHSQYLTDSQENFMLLKDVKHANMCIFLYTDPIWEYDGQDRIEKLMDRSFARDDISESGFEEDSTFIPPPEPEFPFAETAVIVIPLSDDSHDCEKQENCYLPMHLHIEKDTLVTWHNFDDDARSIVSGNPIDGPDGIFESGIIGPGESFSHRFEQQTIQDYYDMLHQWEIGKVTVTGKVIDREERMTIIEGMSLDGAITIELEAMNPTAGKAMGIHAKFIGKEGSLVERINYDLVAIQDGQEVLTLDDNHSHAGIDEHWTMPLISDSPIDVRITILGIGDPGQEQEWTGPKGEVVMFHIVPEFGTVAMMVLAVAIISIVAISARSRLCIAIPRY